MNTEINQHENDRIIEAFLRGSISSEERVQLQQWLSDDEANKKYFRQMVLLWKGSALYDKSSKDVQTAFEKTRIRILASETGSVRPFRSIRTPLAGILKYAAVILLSLVSGALLYTVLLKGHYTEKDLTVNEISVPLGSKSHIQLPDSTEVWLNAGSRLSYDFRYGIRSREVKLTGEGYFTVTRNTAKPFIVHTAGARIRALGTEFNVKAYPDEKVITAILVKGSVEVSKTYTSGNSDRERVAAKLILMPGHKLMVDKERNISGQPAGTRHQDENRNLSPDDALLERNGFQLIKIDPVVETSWKEDRWIINGEYLADLCVLLSRRYNISINITNHQLAQYKFSGTLQKETLEQVFEILSLTVPISYSIEKGKATLYYDPKLGKKYKGAYTTVQN
jgi:transmembrane sensor